MSCNGCRVLRRGCSESCILRPCLQWIESPESQGHATVFVAKFFGRAGLMSFISNVPHDQRPALFQSLLFEAAGRTVNPVNGAVGLLGTGNWHLCQAAVETVLRGGALRPTAEIVTKGQLGQPEIDEVSDCTDMFKIKKESNNTTSPASSRSMVVQKRRRMYDNPLPVKANQLADLDLSLTSGFQNSKKGTIVILAEEDEKRRLGSPSMNSEESVTTTCLENGGFGGPQRPLEELKLLNLFY